MHCMPELAKILNIKDNKNLNADLDLELKISPHCSLKEHKLEELFE